MRFAEVGAFSFCDVETVETETDKQEAMCPWDSPRWPFSAPLSLPAKLYSAGRLLKGPFRVPSVTKVEWIKSAVADWQISDYTVHSLMIAPTDDTSCLSCGAHRHFNRACDQTRPFKQCSYILCTDQTRHTKQHCPVLNNRCSRCLCRGHLVESERCLRVFENFELFEAEARFVQAKEYLIHSLLVLCFV